MKIKIWLLAVVLGLGLAHLWAAEPKGINLGYGIFKKVELAGTHPALSERPRGRRLTVKTDQLVTPTNQIPCELGTTFGLRYCITNLALADGEELPLHFEISHPSMPTPNGKVEMAMVYDGKATVLNGQATYVFLYELTHEYQLVPGYWEMDISLYGQTLLRQSFQLVKPGETLPAKPSAAPASPETEKKSAPPS